MSERDSPWSLVRQGCARQASRPSLRLIQRTANWLRSKPNSQSNDKRSAITSAKVNSVAKNEWGGSPNSGECTPRHEDYTAEEPMTTGKHNEWPQQFGANYEKGHGMSRSFTISAFGLLLGVVCVMSTGCKSGGSCRRGSCGASSYSSPVYSEPVYSEPPYSEPAYSPLGGSGTRSAPIRQGSGSR